MATLPAFLKKTGIPVEVESSRRSLQPQLPARPERTRQQLRPLPHEDVFFYSKKIDNSRLVREPDPQARGACWSAIAGAAVVLALLTSILAPSVASTLAGYKLEALRAEERRLLNDRRVLQLREAELVRPDRLEALAKGQNLIAPVSGQTVRLEGKADRNMAMVK